MSRLAGALRQGSAADYYRRPERHTDEYREGNVERTRRRAATIPPETAAAFFRDVWHRTSRAFACLTSSNESRLPAAP